MPVLTSFYETNPDAELAIYPVVTEDDTAADGITVTPAYRSNNPFGMMVGFSSSATEDELKAAWMYLEWMCNDDVLFTMQYGIEGENFNYNEDGLPVSVADYSGDYKQGYNSSGDTGAVRQHLRQQYYRGCYLCNNTAQSAAGFHSGCNRLLLCKTGNR